MSPDPTETLLKWIARIVVVVAVLMTAALIIAAIVTGMWLALVVIVAVFGPVWWWVHSACECGTFKAFYPFCWDKELLVSRGQWERNDR